MGERASGKGKGGKGQVARCKEQIAKVKMKVHVQRITKKGQE
jgi:hypothetical protein